MDQARPGGDRPRRTRYQAHVQDVQGPRPLDLVYLAAGRVKYGQPGGQLRPSWRSSASSGRGRPGQVPGTKKPGQVAGFGSG